MTPLWAVAYHAGLSRGPVLIDWHPWRSQCGCGAVAQAVSFSVEEPYELYDLSVDIGETVRGRRALLGLFFGVVLRSSCFVKS